MTKVGLLIAFESRAKQGVRVTLDGLDVTARCFAADDRYDWVVLHELDADGHKYVAADGVVVGLYSGCVVIECVAPFSLVTFIADVVSQARILERERVEERLREALDSRVMYEHALADHVWDRAHWLGGAR